MQSDPAHTWKQIADIEILARLATTAALSSNWEEAVLINEKILKISPNEIEALNRLARAQLCVGEILKAQKTYKKVLSLDPYNVIATKNCEMLSKNTGNSSPPTKQNNGTQNLATIFISEPGKTKVINLLNLAQPSVLSNISYGEKLLINCKTHSITITTSEGIYLGALPDDLAHRIIAFINGGNLYEAYVKAISPKLLTIFIKETFRSEKFINQPSFHLTQSSYLFSE